MVGLSDFMRGIGAGMTSYGGSYIELDREKKLAALKKEEWGAEREFKMTENKADRELQWKIANLPKGSASSRPKAAMTALGPDGEQGYKEIDVEGAEWFVDPVTRERIPWSDYSKSKSPVAEEESAIKISEEAQKWADEHTKLFSLDESDLEIVEDPTLRDEDRLSKRKAELMSEAFRQGPDVYKRMKEFLEAGGAKEQQLKNFNVVHERAMKKLNPDWTPALKTTPDGATNKSTETSVTSVDEALKPSRKAERVSSKSKQSTSTTVDIGEALTGIGGSGLVAKARQRGPTPKAEEGQKDLIDYVKKNWYTMNKDERIKWLEQNGSKMSPTTMRLMQKYPI